MFLYLISIQIYFVTSAGVKLSGRLTNACVGHECKRLFFPFIFSNAILCAPSAVVSAHVSSYHLSQGTMVRAFADAKMYISSVH